MTERTRALFDGAVPGANLGGSFAASIQNLPVTPQPGENYLESLLLSFKADDATAVVSLAAFLDLVNPLQFNAGAPLTQIRGRDAFALSTAWYGIVPRYREGAIGEDDKVAGIKVPVWAKTKPAEAWSFFITRVAVTNLSGEVLRLTGDFLEKAPNTGRLDIRQIPVTTPAALGITQLVPKLPKTGRLLGLLVFSTSVPSFTVDTASIERLFIDGAKTRYCDLHWQDLSAGLLYRPDSLASAGTQSPGVVALDNYGFADFRDDPIDLVAEDIAINADVGVVSEAVRLLPIIEVPQ